MAFDRNPKFGVDQSFTRGARQVADLLWEMSEGNLSSITPSYLVNLRHQYEDGSISMLEVIDRVDLGQEASYEDYCELVDSLLKVDPSEWPHPEDILTVSAEALQFQIEPDFDFSEFEGWDFEEEVMEEEAVVEVDEPDPFSAKMETFLKKVIASVYIDGVSDVTDMEGNPPNAANNYLLSGDGKTYKGIFYDTVPNGKSKQFPFTITENEQGKWSIKY